MALDLVHQVFGRVCKFDGVPVALVRSGAYVHTGEIPKGVDPEHAAVPVTLETYEAAYEQAYGLRAAAEDMLVHHANLHPLEACAWAQRLSLALRSA